MSETTPHLGALLQAMDLPPDLAVHAPLSAQRRLHTMPLRDSVLVKGLPAEFDDNCWLTVADGDEELPQVKLNLHAGKRQYRGCTWRCCPRPVPITCSWATTMFASSWAAGP